MEDRRAPDRRRQRHRHFFSLVTSAKRFEERVDRRRVVALSWDSFDEPCDLGDEPAAVWNRVEAERVRNGSSARGHRHIFSRRTLYAAA
jgi:hypothetical protein